MSNDEGLAEAMASHTNSQLKDLKDRIAQLEERMADLEADRLLRAAEEKEPPIGPGNFPFRLVLCDGKR